MPIPTKIYHITDADNLPSIVTTGELRSHNILHHTAIAYQSIAHTHIQDRRSTTKVPCGASGTLHDYVPFYFAPRSPMLYTINRGNVEQYPQRQARVVHLTTSIEQVQTAGIPFVFTDGHAIMAFSRFFSELAQLDQIDWKVMSSTYWNDTTEYPDRCRRRQAEFLIHQTLPWELITEIGVYSRQMQAEVVTMLQSAVHQPVVQIRREWYY